MTLHLQPYGTFTEGDGDPRERARRPYYPEQIKLSDPKSAKKWWQAHSKLTLREMQLEALEWVIAEEEKQPDEFEDVERAAMRRLLKKLRESDQPLPPGSPWAK